MFLACDIGNTNIKTSIYDKDNRNSFNIFPTDNIQYNCFCEQEISEAAISSVVPNKTGEIIRFLQRELKIDPYIININSKFNLSINYKTPHSLGIDRICAAEGAYKLFENDNPDIPQLEKFYLLIIDLGTATTLNFVNYKIEYEGGIILPGIRLMADSLNINTAQLPKIDFTNYTSFIGKDTHSSIASGIINSTVSLIEKAYQYLTNIMGAEIIKIYITGGNARVIQPYINYENTLVDDLVLRGVKAIFERNKVE